MQFACEIIISPRSDILDPEGDAIGRRIGLAFGPYQSDPLMMRIAEYAERFLVERQRRNAVEGA